LMSKAVDTVPNSRMMRNQAIDLAIRLREFTTAAQNAQKLLELFPDDPAGTIGRARAKMGLRDSLGAYSDLQLAIKTKPDDADLNYWFGMAAKEMGKVDEARIHIEKARTLDPKRADAVVAQMIEAVERGKFGDALRIADEASPNLDQEDRPKVRATRAYILARRHLYKEAAAEYEATLKESPRDTEARARYAALLADMRLPEQADKQIAEAALLDGKNPAVLVGAGDVFLAREQYKQALEKYEEAMQLAPNNYIGYIRAAVAAVELNDVQRAKGLVETADQLRPGSPEVQAARARVLSKTDPKQAASILQLAAETSPDDPHLLYLLATTHINMGGYIEAIETLAKATTVAPAFDDAWFALGKANRELGRSGDATAAFEKAIEVDPRRADAWIQIANLRSLNNDDAGALLAYDKAIKVDPNDPKSICAMGETLVVRMGEDAKNLKKGMEVLERCTKLDNEHPSAWKILGNAYKTINKRKDAIAAYKTHLSVAPEDQEASIIRDYIVDLGGKL
jgi:tetratricopeptide (TPR) repeat protein